MPRVARPADLMTGLFLIALAALTYWQAAELPMGSAVRMGAGYVPRLLSFLLAGFGLALLAVSLGGAEERSTAWSIRPLLCVLLVPIVFALTIERFGVIAAVVACTLVASSGSLESRPVEAIMLSAALAVFTLALFVWALAIPMRPLPAW
jgi:hypothetical protein